MNTVARPATALPGIVLQLVLIPVVMVGLEHAFNLATRENEEWSPSEEK